MLTNPAPYTPRTHRHSSASCLVGGPLTEYGCGYQHETQLCMVNVVTVCVCEHGYLVELVRMESGIVVNREGPR